MQYVDLVFSASCHGNDDTLPPFLGATLRGAFGHWLKRTVCQVAHGRCEQCLLGKVCPYPMLFEGAPPESRAILRKYPRIPQPFVLCVPPPSAPQEAGDGLRWGVRLFGPAIRYWPYVVHVFEQAGVQGIGRSRVTYELCNVRDGYDGPWLWQSGEPCGSEPQPRTLPTHRREIPEHCALRWKFQTPLKLRTAARFIDGLQLFQAGLRRFQIMSHFYGEPVIEDRPWLDASAFQTHETRVRSWSFRRFSGRQKRSMTMRGMLGEAVIEGPWGRSGKWLAASPILHLGKATSFGFGQVSWDIA